MSILITIENRNATKNIAASIYIYSIPRNLKANKNPFIILMSLNILNMLLKHCNANGVTMATGEAAQLQQAYDLNIINTAQEREDASGPS